MAEDPTTKLPPLENYDKQIFSYGFMLDRSSAADYSGTLQPGQSGRNGFANPDPEDLHILNLNPQQIQAREPFATSVTFTQGGGKVIESRGAVVKDYTIRGTTGFLPPKNPAADHMATVGVSRSGLLVPDFAQEEQLQQSSGFYEFYRLRRLFRRFGAERRAGEVVFMHYLDFKGDEFWLIEPQAFDMTRTRFGYNYTITFRTIEPSESNLALSSTTNNIVTQSQLYGVLDADQEAPDYPPGMDPRTDELRNRQRFLSLSGQRFVTSLASAQLRIAMQKVLTRVGEVQTFFADAATLRRDLLAIPLGLFKQVDSALTGLLDALEDNTPEAFKRDVNEWATELIQVNNHMFSDWQSRYGQTIGQALLIEDEKFTTQRAVQGTRNQVITEEEDSAGSLAVDPTLGSAGFSLIGDVQRMRSLSALRSEDIYTNENIFDIAKRLLGDTNRFVDLVIINNLAPPYIVASSDSKPQSTLAWGEQILVPTADATIAGAASSSANSAPAPSFSGTVSDAAAANELTDADIPAALGGQWREDEWNGYTVEMLSGAAIGEKRVVISNTDETLTVNRNWSVNPSPGDTYKLTLEQFSIRRASTPDTEAYGRDILAVFTYDTVSRGIDVRLGPSGDLLTAEGLENFEQAMALRMEHRQGTLPLHPKYGSPGVIGGDVEPNTLALHTFFARQGLLSDPRTQAVRRPRYSVDGGALRFEAEVQPIRARKPTRFRVALR